MLHSYIVLQCNRWIFTESYTEICNGINNSTILSSNIIDE